VSQPAVGGDGLCRRKKAKTITVPGNHPLVGSCCVYLREQGGASRKRGKRAHDACQSCAISCGGGGGNTPIKVGDGERKQARISKAAEEPGLLRRQIYRSVTRARVAAGPPDAGTGACSIKGEATPMLKFWSIQSSRASRPENLGERLGENTS